MYQVLGGDGREYGPIGPETVRQWITDARLGAASRIRAEGSIEWKTLAEFEEFREALSGLGSAARSRSQFPQTPPNVQAKTSRLAVASLVLGILGFLVATAIASLVCGIIAMVKIKRSQGQLRGQGLAIAGVCISGLILVLFVPLAIMVSLLVPAVSTASTARSTAMGRAQTILCVNNLKQVGLALRIYATDHNDQFPSDLLQLTNELGAPMALFCPADAAHPRPTSSSWWGITTNNISYEFLTPGAYDSNLTSAVMLRCPIHGNTCLGDGSVHQNSPPPAPRPK